MEESKNLSEYSSAYYADAKMYDAFSQAEDAENKIFAFLLPHVRGKRVLDAGCGTGKYLALFAPCVKEIVGIDASAAQLAIAKTRTQNLPNVHLVQADLASAHKQAGGFDVIIACWVVGTILDEEKRALALAALEKLLQPEGKLLLVENDVGGEFEAIRGRINDPALRTKTYNEWLCKTGGFLSYHQLETHFSFDSLTQAKQVFGDIWGTPAAKHVLFSQIQHKIAIFMKEKPLDTL